MDYSIETDEDTIDLSKYTVQESCLWLLNRLRVNEHNDDAYTLPFCSYVITWYKSIPLTCIIMAQNPYPQNVYSPIAAAMSYSTELAQLQVKRRIYKVPIPPTVEIFANDMYINANMKKEDTVNILKNGWALIDKGILIVNEGVFTKNNDPEYYDESSNQCNVIIRMLRETEKHGSRVVDIYGLGEAGQRMASNLCSWYKSSIVRLSKHTATHPAALSRRFENFNHSDCHLGTPSFSKSLAKHLSNHVAYAYTMAKKSEADIKIQRYTDIIRSAGPPLADFDIALKEFNGVTREAADMEYDDIEKTKAMFNKLNVSGENLAFRSGLASSALSNVQRVGDGISGHVSKPGPSLQNPSTALLSQHIGRQDQAAKQLSNKPIKLSLTKSKSSLPTTESSSFVDVPPPASVVSIQSNTTPNKLKLTKSRSINSTPTKPLNFETSSLSNNSNISSEQTDKIIADVISEQTDAEQSQTKSSAGARFRKKNLVVDSNKSENFGQQKKESISNGPLALTKDQKDQLSAVQAVVESQKPEATDDTDAMEKFEIIQHDISNMTKYNAIVQELVEAIDKDMKAIINFNFVEWAIDDSKPSATYDACKEIFDF